MKEQVWKHVDNFDDDEDKENDDYDDDGMDDDDSDFDNDDDGAGGEAGCLHLLLGEGQRR